MISSHRNKVSCLCFVQWAQCQDWNCNRVFFSFSSASLFAALNHESVAPTAGRCFWIEVEIYLDFSFTMAQWYYILPTALAGSNIMSVWFNSFKTEYHIIIIYQLWASSQAVATSLITVKHQPEPLAFSGWFIERFTATFCFIVAKNQDASDADTPQQ